MASVNTIMYPSCSMKKGRIAHIVWDWNGTLLDDVGACVKAINAMLRHRDLPQLTARRYREIFEFPVRNYYHALGFDFQVEEWDSLAREFHENYAVTSREAVLRGDAVNVLTAIRERGTPMSVLSASELSILERMLESMSIRFFFENVLGLSDLYASSKLDLGRDLIARVDEPPGELLLIGDTDHDHAVATELGCRCVLLAGGHQSAHRLAKCGCEVLNGEADIVGFLRSAE